MAGNAVLQALKDAWRTLEPLNAPMAVMGGIALAAWEHVRSTQDVDLLIGFGQTEAERVLSRVALAGFRPKRDPPVVALGDLHLIQLLYEGPGTFVELQVDLLLGTSDYHRTALSRRVAIRLPGLDLDVAVLTCEDLILHKLLADRIVDRADCAALLTANRDSLDRSYLAYWSNRLALTAGLAQAWRAAFPADSSDWLN